MNKIFVTLCGLLVTASILAQSPAQIGNATTYNVVMSVDQAKSLGFTLHDNFSMEEAQRRYKAGIVPADWAANNYTTGKNAKCDENILIPISSLPPDCQFMCYVNNTGNIDKGDAVYFGEVYAPRTDELTEMGMCAILATIQGDPISGYTRCRSFEEG